MVDTCLVRPRKCWAEPEVPIKTSGDLVRSLGTVDALRPYWPIGPDVKFLWLANHAGVNDFYSTTQAFVCAALVAHLGCQLFLTREIAHDPGFPDRLRERFLNIGMLAHRHGGNCRDTVAVVRGGDCYCINLVLHLLKEFPEILVLFGLRKFLAFAAEHIGIDIAQGRDFSPFARSVIGVAATFSPDPDTGYPDLGVEILSAHDGGEP